MLIYLPKQDGGDVEHQTVWRNRVAFKLDNTKQNKSSKP